MDLRRKLGQRELEREAQRIMNGESGSKDGLSGDDDSLDEQQSSGTEHYTFSDDEEPYVLERNIDGDQQTDDIVNEGPRPKKKKNTYGGYLDI